MSDQQPVQKLAPNSQESEEALLGSILINPEIFDEMLGLVRVEDFYYMHHQFVFTALLDLREEGLSIDALTVVEKLRTNRYRDGQTHLDAIGGSAFITSLINNTPTHVHAETYARLVARLAVRRRLLDAASTIAKTALDDTLELEEVISEIERVVSSVMERTAGGDMVPMNIAVKEYLDRLDYLYQHRGAPLGTPTGYADLDKMLGGGFQPSDLIFIGGRPGMGKTALMLSMAANAAAPRLVNGQRCPGSSVALFSLEMSRSQLVQRFFSGETGIDSQKMRNADFDDRMWDRIVDSLPRLDRLNLHIDDTPRISLSKLRAKCKRLQRRHGLDMIVIDYLQLMGTPGFKPSERVQALSELTRSLKELAKEFNVPVIVAAQFNRELEKRSDKRPGMSDFRESGSVEADGDIALGLFADDVYNPKSEKPNQLEIIFLKHRNGPTGTVDLFFARNTTKFYSMDYRSQYHGADGRASAVPDFE